MHILTQWRRSAGEHSIHGESIEIQVPEAARESAASSYFRQNGPSVALITIVAWVANYLHFTSFGLYDDDWFYVGFPLLVSFKEWILGNMPGQFRPGGFQGRPLQTIFEYCFSEFGALAGNLAVDYLVAYVLFAGSALLIYEVLRRRFSTPLATIASVLFVLTPLHTLHQFLNGQFTVGPAFCLIFSAMLLYQRGKSAWSYALAIPTLLTYESIFFIFLGAPLLRAGPSFRGRHREWLRHAGVFAGLVAIFFLFRRLLAETRVGKLPGNLSLMGHVLYEAIFQTFASFVLYLYAALRVHEASLEGWLYAAVFLVALIALVYRQEQQRISSPAARRQDWWQHFEPAAIGVGFLFLGYALAYFFFQEATPSLHLTDRETRISVAASFGSSIVFAAFFTAGLRTAKSKAARLVVYTTTCGFLLTMFLYSFVLQQDYVDDWKEQRIDAAQMMLLTPDVSRDSVIVLRMHALGLPFFTSGRRRRAIGLEKTLYEWVFPDVFAKGEPWPHLFVVFSDAWPQHLAAAPDGRLGWPEPTFDGRWYPSSGDYHFRPGRFIVLEEVEPGVIVRHSNPITVEGTQIVQQAPSSFDRVPVWASLRSTPLIREFLPDFAWRSTMLSATSSITGNSPPSVVSGSPASTGESAQTFTFVARDPDGFDDIYRIYFLVNPNPTIPANTCHGFYDWPSNSFYLYNDGISIPQGPLQLASSSTLQNSQCILKGNASAVISSGGTDISLSIGLALKGSYLTATNNVYLWVKDNEKHDTGWVKTGTWNPAAASSPRGQVSP